MAGGLSARARALAYTDPNTDTNTNTNTHNDRAPGRDTLKHKHNIRIRMAPRHTRTHHTHRYTHIKTEKLKWYFIRVPPAAPEPGPAESPISPSDSESPVAPLETRSLPSFEAAITGMIRIRVAPSAANDPHGYESPIGGS